VPAKASEVEESAALLLKESAADVFPFFCGVNVTLSETPLPAGIVFGKTAPGRANCELLLDAEEIVTLPPTALKVAVCVAVVPTITLPKLSVAGATVNCTLALSPVPASGTFSDGPEKYELPPVRPVACGLKVAFNCTL
jgi:hypothetical protein